MRRSLAAALLLAAAPLAGGPARAAEDDAAAALARVRAIEEQLVGTVAAVSQSSVTVLVSKFDKPKPGEPAPKEPRVAGGGSGVIVTRDQKSYVLTNQHVIQEGDRIEVVCRDGSRRRVELEDSVPNYDIALLRFVEKPTGLKAVAVRGKASAELEEGQWCVATGNPFFLATDGAPVVTLGVISGLERVLGGAFQYGRAIQHDAAVNPGNSGGPLWNLKGEFVGINGMITFHDVAPGQQPSNTGAAYSIPVEQIDAFLKQLIDAKKDAQAAFLGVATETAKDAQGRAVGARVTSVDPASPASSARNRTNGLAAGDVIETFMATGKSHAVKTSSDLANALSIVPAGTKVTIKFRRGSQVLTWTGTLEAKK